MKKNVASQKVIFGIYNNDAEAMASTDLSANCSVQISKDGGAFVTGTGAIAEVLGAGSIHIGQFSYTPTQAETNADCVKFVFACSGGVNYEIDSQTFYPDNIADIWALVQSGGSGDLAAMKTDLTSTKNAANNMATAFELIP